MKCNKCGSEWKTDPTRSASLTVCPFCQAEIIAEKSSGWKYFDNTKELLEYVASEYGNDALFGRKYFSDHSAPLMQQGQKNLVKQAFDCGAVKILQDNMNTDQQRKEIAVKQAVGKLVDTYASARDAAERVVWEFTNALGWGMPEPQIPKPPQKQQSSSSSNKLPPQSSRTPMTPASSAVARGMIFLEDGDVARAHEYFEKALDADPYCSGAYLGNLLLKLRLKNIDELKQIPYDISDFNEYSRALTYADDVERVLLEEIQESTQRQIAIYKLVSVLKQFSKKKAVAEEAERKRKAAEEEARKKHIQDAFNNACKIMDSARSTDDCRKAITAFSNIDSTCQDINSKIKAKIAECENKKATIEAEQKAAAEAARKKRVQDAFDNACKIITNAQSTDDYKKAIAALSSIDSDYQDINSQIKNKMAECEQKMKQIMAEEAKREQIKQKYEADHKAWQVEYNRLKTAYDAEYKKWETESNAFKAQADSRKSQGLCPHCGGTLKGLFSKKCTVCGQVPSDPLKTLAAPPQPNYPIEPKLPRV